MPDGNNSYYTDMVYSRPYWIFTSEELPDIARHSFLLSTRGEENSVARLSMGGYGASKLAFTYPERYCSAVSFSGALDLPSWMDQSANNRNWKSVFGENPDITDSGIDLKWLSARKKEVGAKLPALSQCCGTDDFT